MFTFNDIVQVNPVIYVFLCDDADLIEGIKREQQPYEIGIRYITVSDVDFLKNLDEIHQAFIRQEYKTVGTVRINYVYYFKTKSNLLFQTIDNVEEAMTKYYPGGITSDVFIILDELDQKADSIIDFEKLISIRHNLNMVYLLSNINSNGLLLEQNKQRIIKAISKLFVVKDTSTPEQTERRFDERYFREDGETRNGDFFTVGYAHIAAAAEEIIDIMTLKVLNNTIKREADIDVVTKSIYAPVAYFGEDELENVSCIAINKNSISKAKNITKRQTIEFLYGQRLDKYFDRNYTAKAKIIEASDVSRLPYGLFEIYNTVREGSTFDTALKEQISASSKQLDDAAKDLNAWLSEYINITLDLLPKKYIDKRISILNRELKHGTLLNIQSTIASFNKFAGQFYNIVVDEMKQVEQKTYRALRKMPTITTAYLLEYYELLALKLIDAEFNAYLASFNGEAQDYYTYVRRYCAKKTTDQLCSIDKDLKNRIEYAHLTEESVAMLLLDTIITQKLFNLSIKSDDTNKQVEITLVLDEYSSLAKHISFCNDKVTNYKISVVFEKNKPDIDIIYQMGTFKIHELYYAQLLEL